MANKHYIGQVSAPEQLVCARAVEAEVLRVGIPLSLLTAAGAVALRSTGQ